MNSIHCAVRPIEHGGLDLSAGIDFVSDPAFGGIACFVGRVRAQNGGRAVSGISYDIHPQLALRLFQQLAAEVKSQYGPDLKLYVEHACGRLAIGDVAVVVAAGSAHRDAAFRACRALIEAVKHRAPIWKQEHYLDGDSAWSEGCSLCPGHTTAHDRLDAPAPA